MKSKVLYDTLRMHRMTRLRILRIFEDTVSLDGAQSKVDT